MYRIIKIGMDVHSKSFSLCAVELIFGEPERMLATLKVPADHKEVLTFIQNLKKQYHLDDSDDITCGYEAGCLGFSLYKKLAASSVKCVILAPSTMLDQRGKRIKTDARDAVLIAKCLAQNTYHAVQIPTEEDDAIKEYIRMRDDHKMALKKLKQQINAFCLRHDLQFSGNHWTQAHIKWLRKIKLSPMYQETLDEYLSSYEEQESRLERLDERIEKLASGEKYAEKVKKLGCFLGIKTHTALSLIVETGDFQRFPKGNVYAAYLGLAPGESSSADHINRTGITKAGNHHLRRLLVEASHGICKGVVGQKSRTLIARQKGNTAAVIAYADAANRRLRKKYYRLMNREKKRNVAVAAVARELACFVWGMMTDNIELIRN